MNQLILLLFCFFLITPAMAEISLCPDVVLHGDDDLEFSDTEKRLACGDKKVAAYSDIPSYQASFFLTGFLQTRGFLKPVFEVREGVLHVELGAKSYFKKITVISESEKISKELDDELERLFEGKLLNIDLLNKIELEGTSYLRKRGYPCVKVKSSVDATDNSITINIENLNLFSFGEIKKESIEGLEENAFARYYPFQAEDRFNELKLNLTEKRMLRSEVVQGTYFLEECLNEEKEFSLSQQFILGPPRTIRFGVGASTEVGPMARVRWSHNRHKSMASLLSANLQASFRVQSLELMADSFFWKHKPRRSLYSKVELMRESQIDYEQLVLRVKPHVKWTRDMGDHLYTYTLGPTYEAGNYLTNATSNTRSFSSGAAEGSFTWMNHVYEFFDQHPERGDVFQFNFDARHPAVGFSDPLLKLETTYVNLSKLADSGRGALVGGVRVTAATTWVSDDVALESLPPTVKHFGGGSDDTRGFMLRTLPKNNGLGALSKLGLKLELRRTNVFLNSLEAFTFIDHAYFGDKSWSTNPQLFYSPGAGMRWLSPIGLVQAFVARAYATNPHKDFGYFGFLGLGGSF